MGTLKKFFSFTEESQGPVIFFFFLNLVCYSKHDLTVKTQCLNVGLIVL